MTRPPLRRPPLRRSTPWRSDQRLWVRPPRAPPRSSSGGGVVKTDLRIRLANEKGVLSMIPASFDYHAPTSLSDAIALLQRHGDQAKVLSGGQSLLPLLKLRVGAAGHLVDIGRIPGLEYIKEEDGFLKIGGRTRESALERSDIVRT